MKGFVISLGLHIAALFALFFQWPAASAPATAPHAAVKPFVPADLMAEKKSPPPPKSNKPGLSIPKEQKPSNLEGKPKLDVAALQLTIEDDIGGEMIVVLKRYRGKIVIIDPATRNVLRAFWASTAKPASGVSVSDGLAVLLGDPAYWHDIAAVELGSVDSAVCALFPPDFADALGVEIQNKAAQLGVNDIKAAIVAFSARQRSGIVIKHVS